jgi:hypothetical protein
MDEKNNIKGCKFYSSSIFLTRVTKGVNVQNLDTLQLTDSNTETTTKFTRQQTQLKVRIQKTMKNRQSGQV